MPDGENSFITHIDGIRSTIMTDSYVFRWFTFLVMQPEYKQQSSGQDKIKNSYSAFYRANIIQWLIGLTAGGCLYYFITEKSWLFLTAGILAWIFVLRCQKIKKSCIADIAVHYLLEDYSQQQVAQMTLYQISERYAKKYNILSIVDAVFGLDSIYRFSILFIIFLVVCIVNFTQNLIEQIALIVVFYTITTYLMRTSFFYKRLIR